MPSIVQGFEYDIFISYRQKDNKYDGWVTEFVANLKKELEATFKEDISIYFDENPHDGLHENHDVDDSLRDKLKCLVFIPIVSRTYCDPKSFAWEQEFKVFLTLGSKDSHGLKVKLPNSNVASRVLPVRIHELESEDVKLIESEIQGVLRPIDFVFKSSGVNRPLLPADKKEENSNHTFYRDQINKVANAISEIISALKKSKGSSEKSNIESPIPVETKVTGKKSNRNKILVTATTLILLVSVAYFLFNRPGRLKDPGTSGVAILPFRNNTGSEDLNYYGVGIASDIRTKLSMSKQFSFISSLQATLPYINTTKSTRDIGSELGVDFILSGLYQKVGNKIKVDAELVDAENGKVVWALPFEKEMNDILQVQAEIADEVLGRFSRNKHLTSGQNTLSLEAYEHFIKGLELYNNSNINNEDTVSFANAYQSAILQFQGAIALDSGYVDAWVGLIDVESWVFLQVPNDPERESRINKYVNHFNSHFRETWQKNIVNGIYAYRITRDYTVALTELNKVLENDPENLLALDIISPLYKRQLTFDKAIYFKKKIMAIDPGGAGDWRDLGNALQLMGDGKNALKALLNAWDLSHSRTIAQFVLFVTLEFGLPLDKLPPDLKAKLGSEFDQWNYAVQRDWQKFKRVSLSRKDYLMISFSYSLEKQRDSTTYWANQGLKQSVIPFEHLLYALKGNHEKAFATIDHEYKKLIESKDDRMSLFHKMEQEVFNHVFLNEFPEATEKLKKINEMLPDLGEYDGFINYPWMEKIKKDYPPFLEAYKNLKRKPMLDVNEYIKM